MINRKITLAATDAELIKIATKICEIPSLTDPSVCSGAVSEMTPIIVKSLVAHYLSADFICPLLSICPQKYQAIDLQALVQQIVASKPQKARDQPTLRKTLKVLHFSDVHIDLLYKAGAIASCNKPVCCREDSVQNPRASEVLYSGKWGNLNTDCDLPVETL